MGKKDIPEGLEEMAKHDGLERGEVQDIYREILGEVKETDVQRRTLLKAFAGGGGLAVLNGLVAQKKFEGDSLESGLAAIQEHSGEIMGVRRVDEPPYEIDEDVYQRWGSRSTDTTDFGRFSDIFAWIRSEGGSVPEPDDLLDEGYVAAGAGFGKNVGPIQVSSPGEARALNAIGEAIGSHAFDNPGGVMLDVDTMEEYVPDHLKDRPPEIDDPVTLRDKLWTVARFAGCCDLGVTDLDRSMPWMHANLKFRSVDAVEKKENGDYIIPKEMNTVVVAAVEQPLMMGKSNNRNFGKAASSMGYWRRRGASNILSLFIRNMGYRAVPDPDTINVPLAIDAGIAEGGRHGRAVHPVFGGNYRPIVKVLTDMPLERDQFIDFGLQQFCEGCKLCAEACPSNSIPYGEKTWEYEGSPPAGWDDFAETPWDASKNPGVYHWYQEPASCLRFWQENARSCGTCMYQCPFTQGRSWLHDVIRVVAGRSAAMDATLVNMDKAMGYHDSMKPEDLWDQDYLPYGILQDPLLGSF